MTEFRFYSHYPGKPGACFSNFSPHGVKIGGHYYPTTEHYYQAMKFTETDQNWAVNIKNARTPGEAKRFGGDKTHTLNPQWEQIKDDIMRVALKAKAEQHPDFREALLSTGNMILIENSPTDYYWGCGRDNTGKNMLGKLLMELRESLR